MPGNLRLNCILQAQKSAFVKINREIYHHTKSLLNTPSSIMMRVRRVLFSEGR